MKHMIAIHLRKFSLIALPLIILSSCATRDLPYPPEGKASFHADWSGAKSELVSSSKIVSVNDQKVRGSKANLEPGRNCVRVKFRWPQGHTQEVDMVFQAKAGKRYFIKYDVYPPYVNRLPQSGSIDEAMGGVATAAAQADRAAFLFVPPLAVLGVASVAARGVNENKERHKQAEWTDLMVVARHSQEGIVEQVRAYPDGRVKRR